MSVEMETREEMAIDRALYRADATQLRRAMRRKLIDAAAEPDEPGTFIVGTDDAFVEDDEAFANARDYWRRGNKREALHHLELALGRDFIGLGDLRPEDLR